MTALVRRNLLAGLAGATIASRARAQSAPPISLLIGYTPGGATDIVARSLAAGLGPRLRRVVVVENVAGASGMLAFQRLVNNRPDGTTIYLGGLDTITVPVVNQNVRLDWRRDTIPVTRLTSGALFFAVPAASPHRDMASFLEAARRAGPEKVSYGTPGVATAQHFIGEAIGVRSGARLLHAPYRGGSLVVNDLLAGNLDSAILVTATALPMIRQGSIRPLTVFSETRVAQFPDVPAINELPGFAGAVFPLWHCIFVRSGTPDAIIRELDLAIRDTLASQQIQAQFGDAGFDVAPLSGSALFAFVESQTSLYAQIAAGAHIRLE